MDDCTWEITLSASDGSELVTYIIHHHVGKRDIFAISLGDFDAVLMSGGPGMIGHGTQRVCCWSNFGDKSCMRNAGIVETNNGMSY
jgi:hypothetical protein